MSFHRSRSKPREDTTVGNLRAHIAQFCKKFFLVGILPIGDLADPSILQDYQTWVSKQPSEV